MAILQQGTVCPPSFIETQGVAQTAAHLVDYVIPRVPVRQWVLSLHIPLRLLLAAQPRLVTPVLQVVHRVITRFLLDQAGLKAEQADSGAVTLIQRFGSAANFSIRSIIFHCDAAPHLAMPACFSALH